MDFIKLKSVDAVCEMLWTEKASSVMIAGGTDLLVRENQFLNRKIIIDLSKLPELRKIGHDDDRIIIGAAVTHQDIVDHPVIQRRARLLVQACSSIGSLQIRNLGTIGGNIANASPAADSLPALACLQADIVLASKEGQRKIALLDFFSGPGQTVMEPTELIESVRIPMLSGRTSSFYLKAGQRKGMCCSKASLAFMARRHSDGKLSKVRVALGAVAPTVVRAKKAEEILEGRMLTPKLIGQAAKACGESANAIDDIRSTREYRHEVVGALLTKGLLEIRDHNESLCRKKTKRKIHLKKSVKRRNPRRKH
jgi:CO/xanthine dehydrogenase FAD-binding subunit